MTYINAFFVVVIILFVLLVNHYKLSAEQLREELQQSKKPDTVSLELMKDYIPRANYEEMTRQLNGQIVRLKEEFAELSVKSKLQEVVNFATTEKLESVLSKQKSEQVRMGLVSENVAPFLEGFPYSSKSVRGLFNPIDLIVFAETEIVFVELKTGNSALSQKQRNIKKLIAEHKVRFEVHRMNENGYNIERSA